MEYHLFFHPDDIRQVASKCLINTSYQLAEGMKKFFVISQHALLGNLLIGSDTDWGNHQ